MADSIKMSIPECKPPKYLNATSLTSELNTVPCSKPNSKTKAWDCSQGVQITNHPPINMKPVFRVPSNRFREEVLRKYPFLVNKDSLYDKKEKILRDPNDPMLSTYKRDYGCLLGEIELIRSQGTQNPLPENTIRLPKQKYKPGLWCPISKELTKLYTLPGGGWALAKPLRDRDQKSLEAPVGSSPPMLKWESEYQANINGIAKYMKKVGALTKRYTYVRRVPTLPN